MLREMNTDIPITFVVVTKRQCVSLFPPSKTDIFSAMSSFCHRTLVTETGRVTRQLEPSLTPRLWPQTSQISISLVCDNELATLYLK